MLSRAKQAIICAFIAAASGCNGGYEGLVPVSGKVTFDGGPPPAGGFVTFMPTERTAGKPSRPGRAVFKEDGVYQATSFQEGDGIYPGRYNVSVVCNKGPVDYSTKDPFNDVSYVANDFQGEELIVEEGSDAITFNLDVPLKKGS